MTVKCQMCGTEYEAAGRNAKFCADCRKQRARDHSRRHRKKAKGINSDVVAERYLAAAKSVEKMNDVLRKADAAGLSYGQYVAEEEGRKTMDKKPEAPTPKPSIVRRLITQALEVLNSAENSCEELGEARGLLTAAKMLLEGEA